MQRRTFVGSAGTLFASQGPSAPRSRRVFILEQYHLKNGTQPARIHDYLSKTLIPTLKRASAGPSIVLEALVAPQMPQVAVITSYASIEAAFSARARMMGDAEARSGFEVWESGAEQPYEQISNTLLEATPYCPELVVSREPRKTPRIFELRVYHSPTWKQLGALHERFAGPEIKIFHRVGVHPILYSSTVFGQNLPNLTYLIPFDDLGAREKAWNAFAADPEWIKVRKESIDRGGQISSYMQISLYRATPYSPIQ